MDDKPEVLILGGSNLSTSEILQLTKTIEANNDVMLVVNEEQESDDMKKHIALPMVLATISAPPEMPKFIFNSREPSWAEMNKGKISKKERRK